MVPKVTFFTRGKSPILNFRCQTPKELVPFVGYKDKHWSTRTADEAEATRFALARILVHLNLLALARTLVTPVEGEGIAESTWAAGRREYADDGSYRQCTKDAKFIVSYDAAGESLGAVANTPVDYMIARVSPKEADQIKQIEIAVRGPARDLDEEMLTNWAEGRFGTLGKVQSDAIAKDARRALTRFHMVTKRSLATMEPADARAMVQLMVDNELSSGTMDKQVGHLKAIVSAAIHANNSKEGGFPAIKNNLWQIRGLVPPNIAGNRSPPVLFEHRELDAIFADIPSWEQDERLLWLFLWHTGARVGEPFQVRGEEEYKGFRSWRYGSKTDESSERLEPIPPELEAVIPELVRGSLFKHGQEKVVYGVMERIRALKIDDVHFAAVGSGKTLASLRPRFVTEADARGGQKTVIQAISGHVPDVFGSGPDEVARNKRNRKGVWWRYMRGHHPRLLLDVMALAAPIRGPLDR